MMYRTTSYDIDEWDTFLFEKNLQGDIVTVYNSDGAACISYKYDAWGNFKESYIGNTPNAAWRNPFKYRGYYYDSDLEMYYLQSRYYDPNTCRFINADSALYHSMRGYNMFVYCENAPVGKIDITGQYCVDIMDDDGNPFNDWLLECASGGGAKAGYYGPSTSYYNYQVRMGTAAYDARLGGYHSLGLSSAMINPNYYCVSGAVTVTDSMATDTSTFRFTKGSTAGKGTQNPKVKAAIEKGQALHKQMDYGAGVLKEQLIAPGCRVDGIDYDNHIIFELKPNNPQAIARGTRQLERYIATASQKFGGKWIGVLILYN